MKQRKSANHGHSHDGSDSNSVHHGDDKILEFPAGQKASLVEQWQKRVMAGIQFLQENNPRWQTGVKPIRVEHSTLNPLAQAKSKLLGHPCELCGALIDTDLTQGELEDLALTVPLRADKDLVNLLNHLWNQAIGLTTAA